MTSSSISRYERTRQLGSIYYIILVTFYGTEVSAICENKLTKKLPRFCRKFFTILFAHILIFIEEVFFIYEFFKQTTKLQKLDQKKFEDLSDKEKIEVEKYFEAKKKQLDRAQKVICRESSIQVVLQNALIVYQERFHFFN